MKVIVLGAGVAGVACAWYLWRDGHEVTVVERNEGVGLETSFANGGQICVSVEREPLMDTQCPSCGPTATRISPVALRTAAESMPAAALMTTAAAR